MHYNHDDPFDAFRNDVVTVVKADDERIERIKASVDPKKRIIDVSANAATINDGDTLIRHLPNGQDEEYLVLDCGYTEGAAGSLPAIYECKVEKKTAIKPSLQAPNIIYNVDISGPNGRFNLHSQDLSVNLVDVDPEQLFKKLRGALAQEVEDDDRRDLLLGRVSDMKNARGTNLPWLSSYRTVGAMHHTFCRKLEPLISRCVLIVNTYPEIRRARGESTGLEWRV